MGARSNFFRPFPFLYFPSVLPSPRCPFLLAKRPTSIQHEGLGRAVLQTIAKISWCVLPFLPLPLAIPSLFPFHSSPTLSISPSLPPFPSSPLSFPVIYGHVNRSYLLTSPHFELVGLEDLCVLCKQRKSKYLKLHIQSTNRKRFSPVVDNIIKNFVFCPKILLHAAISRNPTTHKFLLHTLFRKTRCFWP